MKNWLATHARENLWQDPDADGQLITKPIRLTSPAAAILNIGVSNTTIPLPFEGWGHVYQIGSVHPNWGSINITVGRWVRGTTLMTHFRANVLVYNADGKTYPLHHVYFTKLANGTIIIAMPCKDIYSWAETEDVFLKLYKGFEVSRVGVPEPVVLAEYHQVDGNAHKTTLLQRYRELCKLGTVAVYVKGLPVYEFTTDTMTKWDDVEFHVDGRVRASVDFKLGDLRTFQSSLDSTRKYLLHIGGDVRYSFADDIELYVFYKNSGFYYHGNLARDVRQLTHGDISIPTKRINELMSLFPIGVDEDQIVIRVCVRNDGMFKPLSFNSDRVHELYKLPDAVIIDAMVGANSTVPEWRAANLEESMVNRLTYARWEDIDRDMATKAYGYNAASFYAAETPTKTELTEKGLQAKLPDMLAAESMVYEHRADGTLLGAYYHTDSYVYTATNADCALIEAISGKGSDVLSVDYHSTNFKLSDVKIYSFYMRSIVGGIATNDYTVAVKGTDYVIDNDNNLTWLHDTNRADGVVIDSSKHHLNVHYIDVSDGLFQVIVTDNIDGVVLPSYIPMESVELWLNSHPLVYGVDFTVQWPAATITNKSFMVDGTNEIVVRARGVTGKFREPEYGFVVGGLLSNNSRFDVKDDKVVRIVAGGSLIHREDIMFREDTAVGVSNIADGQPYSVDDPTVPLRDILSGSVVAERDESRRLDAKVEEFLTVYYPTPPNLDHVTIPHWYHVFSPVLNSVIHDLLNGRLTITPDSETKRVSDVQIDMLMKGYTNLLAYDPAFMGYDSRFSTVHPHSTYITIEVTELQFAVIERINHRYLNSVIQLNKYLTIGSN